MYIHAQEDIAPSLVTERPNPDVCEPGTDTSQTNENATTRCDSEAVPSISEVHAQMDAAEIVTGVEVTNGPVHETGQQTAVKSAEVRYSIIIIIIIERKDYGGVLSKTARTPNSFESACLGAPDQKLSDTAETIVQESFWRTVQSSSSS